MNHNAVQLRVTAESALVLLGDGNVGFVLSAAAGGAVTAGGNASCQCRHDSVQTS